ncbi:MAG: stage II sporulation protein D, partial [Bacilli bacterium]|nr:stage II sporulation protein D [Bacilli bacterium]
IIRMNGEEILCVYVNFDMEFAKLNARGKKKALQKDVQKYLKRNNVIFNGTKVALIASGALIGTFLLENPKKETETVMPSSVMSVLTEDSFDVSEVEEKANIKEEIKQEEKDSTKQESVIQTEKKPNKTPNGNSTKQNDTTKKSSSSVNNATSAKTPTVTSSSEVKTEGSTIPENPVSAPEVVPENKTYVTIYRQSGDVITVELEDYVVGVVAAEMPASFNIEALKAQAVIARTYAMKAIQRGTKLTDTSSTQNYKDEGQLKQSWGANFSSYYTKVKNAVLSTKGLYLTYQGQVIDAVYHSTSNGKTEEAQNVWSNAFPYLVSVSSPGDMTNKNFFSEVFLSYEEIGQKMGISITIDSVIEILSKTEGNRVGKIAIDGNEFTGVRVRSLLGLRSADFTFEKLDTGIKITTKGYGHGVGLSQYGANGMAAQGANYKEILTHYYQGVRLVTME